MNFCSKCGKAIGLASEHMCEAMITQPEDARKYDDAEIEWLVDTVGHCASPGSAFDYQMFKSALTHRTTPPPAGWPSEADIIAAIGRVPIRFVDDPEGGFLDEKPVYLAKHHQENIARAIYALFPTPSADAVTAARALVMGQCADGICSVIDVRSCGCFQKAAQALTSFAAQARRTTLEEAAVIVDEHVGIHAAYEDRGNRAAASALSLVAKRIRSLT